MVFLNINLPFFIFAKIFAGSFILLPTNAGSPHLPPRLKKGSNFFRRAKTERDRFVNSFQKGAKILDAGCGAGRDSFYFSSKGFDVVGVDLSEKLLGIAKAKAGHAQNPRFYQLDLRRLLLPKASFDGIWACASLLHLKRSEILGVLREFYELLKPDGRLFVMLKQGTGEADVAEDLSSGHARHFTYYAQEELESLLVKARFSVEEIYLYNEKDRDANRRDLVWTSCFARKV
mgnify:CR=1 FL=1